jgi:hypothetical protein
MARAHYELGKAYMVEGDWRNAADNLDLALCYLWNNKDGSLAMASDTRTALNSLILAKGEAVGYHLED